MDIYFESEKDNIKDIYMTIEDKINDKKTFNKEVVYSGKIVILSNNDSKVSKFKEDIGKELKEFVYDYDIGYLIYDNDKLESKYMCVIKHNPKNAKMLLQMYCLRYGLNDNILEHGMNILSEIDTEKSNIDNIKITYALVEILCEYNDKTIFANPDIKRHKIQKAREYIVGEVQDTQDI